MTLKFNYAWKAFPIFIINEYFFKAEVLLHALSCGNGYKNKAKQNKLCSALAGTAFSCSFHSSGWAALGGDTGCWVSLTQLLPPSLYPLPKPAPLESFPVGWTLAGRQRQIIPVSDNTVLDQTSSSIKRTPVAG